MIHSQEEPMKTINRREFLAVNLTTSLGLAMGGA